MSLLASLLLSLACSPAAPEEPFADLTLPAALAEAQKTEKVVMIDWFTTWCGPCKKLDAETWPDASVRAWLGAHAIALKIDAEKDVETAGRYKVRAYPTLLFLKPDGTEIGRIVGFKKPADFVAAAGDLLSGKSPVDTAREKLAAAGGNDPMLRGDLADALVEQGEHAEALEHYLWCFDHGLERSPSYTGVRVSFLLSDIVRLGALHPPALDALRRRRDAAGTKLLAGGPIAYDVANDFAHLNDALDEPRETLRVYDALVARDDLGERERRSVRDGLFDSVVDLLIEEKRYQDVLDGVGDHKVAVDQRLAGLKRMPGGDAQQAAMFKSFAVAECTPYYEALLGLGRVEEARALGERLIELDSRSATIDRLRRHAKAAGATEEADALRARVKAARDAEREQRKAEKAKQSESAGEER